jgi:hypothetical protein
MRRWAAVMTRAEWLRLGGFGGGVLLLHLLGWGLFLYYARSNPALAGLGSSRTRSACATRSMRIT